MSTVSLIPQLAIHAEASLSQLRRILAEREDHQGQANVKDPLVLMWHVVVGDYAFTGYVQTLSTPCRHENKRFWAHVKATVCGHTLLGKPVSVTLDQRDFDQRPLEGGQDGLYLQAIEQMISAPIAVNYANGGPHVEFAEKVRKVIRKAPEDVKVLDLLNVHHLNTGTWNLAVVRESVADGLLWHVRNAAQERPVPVYTNGRHNRSFWVSLEDAVWQVASDTAMAQEVQHEARTLYGRLTVNGSLANSVWRYGTKEHDLLEYVEAERPVRVDLMTQALTTRGLSESTAAAIAERAAV